MLAIPWGLSILFVLCNFICRFARKISNFCYNSSQRNIFLKFVGILKFVKIHEFKKIKINKIRILKLGYFPISDRALWKPLRFIKRGRAHCGRGLTEDAIKKADAVAGLRSKSADWRGLNISGSPHLRGITPITWMLQIETLLSLLVWTHRPV